LDDYKIKVAVMSTDRVSLELRNRLSELDTLCQSVQQFGEELGLSNKALFQICLAVEEIVGNIISYGYADDAVHWISIVISHKQGILIIRLEDDGIPFNPLWAPEPDCECPVEERNVGNLGIHLCKKVMDEMSYERFGDKNILILKKNLNSMEK
jgi:anti-sigma regulatory factor (Ser/Thr protein kinase)